MATKQKIHIGKNGPAPCKATKRACRYGGDENHYDSMADANAAYEQQLAEEAGGSFNNNSRTRQENETEENIDTQENKEQDQDSQSGANEEEEIRYSFLKDFEKKKEEFEADFGEYPKRFFNANLRGKKIPQNVDLHELADDIDEVLALDKETLPDDKKRKVMLMERLMSQVNTRTLYGEMLHGVSQPKENKEMPIAEAERLAKELGGTNIQHLSEAQAQSFAGRGATRGIIVEFEGGKASPTVRTDERGARVFIEPKERHKYPLEDQKRFIVFTDKPNKKMETFALRRPTEHMSTRDPFIISDLRSLAGGKRIQQKTGDNLLHEAIIENKNPPRANGKSHNEQKTATLRKLSELERAQSKGKGFIDQEKHIRNHSGKVATAWMDKKNPSKQAQEIMDSTSLHVKNGGNFRYVEVDNDVSPEEFRDFEDAYNEIKDKLPPIPADKRPELRVRKLGKHNANGIYFPHSGTIAVDVNTSSAFVHEYAHYVDLTVKENASLSNEFNDIKREYTRSLDEPNERKFEYLSTPTEIFSRIAEMYFHEKKNINNRLLDPRKFGNNDFDPFRKNPKLKEKGFVFLDKVFG